MENARWAKVSASVVAAVDEDDQVIALIERNSSGLQTVNILRVPSNGPMPYYNQYRIFITVDAAQRFIAKEVAADYQFGPSTDWAHRIAP
jgi:hypothetical protein